MKRIVFVTFASVAAMVLAGCQSPLGKPIHSELASDAPKEFVAMSYVTDIHTHFIKDAGFEFRVLEMDGSTTVAMNPVYLYLVVTNNASGDGDQTRMVVLPKISAVQRVSFDDRRTSVVIEALSDSMNEDGSKTIQRRVTIVAKAEIHNGRLAEAIDVTVYDRKG